MRNKDDLDEIFQKAKIANQQIEAVIHFAGLKSISESTSKPLEYWDNNLTGTINLLKIMNKFNCKTIVFSSSASIYQISNKQSLFEDDLINPLSVYGETKFTIEKILSNIYCSSKDWRIANLRYFNPISSHESGLIGENSTTVHSNLMPVICDVATKKLPRLHIYGNDYDTPDGTGVRDYIHVTDLSSAHIDCLRYCLDNNDLEIFNVGTGTGISVLEVVSKFEAVNSIHIEKIFTERRVGDVAISYADPSKIKRVLGWQVKYNLDDMVRSSWLWRQRGLQEKMNF